MTSKFDSLIPPESDADNAIQEFEEKNIFQEIEDQLGKIFERKDTIRILDENNVEIELEMIFSFPEKDLLQEDVEKSADSAQAYALNRSTQRSRRPKLSVSKKCKRVNGRWVCPSKRR